ncbi:MAG: Peptidase M16 [Candidatus Tokpelaia hoelldobleri]|uniref:Peptidase M16 n=1 Tax=Candidatus Tokpelaia hoelldobleri TaxID=1902579 RepID=A0A1U9JVZ4_9HYPH|nr:MAG: Peptidase M16 [Candidatus Tokpelaia hoelldoblerii]
MSGIVKTVMFSALFGTMLSGAPVFAQETLPSVAAENGSLPDIRTVGTAKTFTLANGLQVVVLPDHRAPVVTQMIWYRAGSADEPQGRTGIAHFLEHLMFKGTKNYPAGEFSRKVAAVGGEENAFTSYDFTAYYQSVATQYLEQMMRYESDRMANLILSDEVIAPERQVIIEERRMRTDNSPVAMLAEESRAVLFLNSPYRNPVIGWKQEMEALTRDDAIAFYDRFYTPNNAVLIVAGDVEPETVRDLALATYGRIGRRVETGARVRPQEPASRTVREVVMYDPRVSEPTYQQNWVVPSYHTAKAGQAEALDLLGEILGGSSRSRLYQHLVVDKGIAAAVQAGYQGSAVDDGTFYVYAMPRGEADIAALRAAVDAEIAAIARDGVSGSELEQAIRRYVKTLVFSRDNPEGMAQFYGAALTTGMTLEQIDTWVDRLKTVRPADIKAAAQQYLGADRGVVSQLLPPRAAGKQPAGK